MGPYGTAWAPLHPWLYTIMQLKSFIGMMKS